MNNQNETPLIMIVDDSPANLQLLEEMLHRQGWRVAEFPRGAMALRSATQNPPDLILLDIMMPEMDGFEVCRRLKADETLKEIPVIFISALDDVDNKVKAFSQGGVDYNSYERLRELEDHRDKLVHMIVHDMRSPLTGILGNAQLLEMDLKGTGHDKLASNVEEILITGRILKAMISTLLDISRMESNEMPLERESCDLRNVISEALASLGGLVKETTIVYEPPSKAVTAFCDSEITRRIIENLTANAIKFTGKNGEVRIGLSQEESGAKVTVSDTGPGIPPEYHKRIFEKFGQVAARQEGKKYSTGLGLTFCKLAVDAQGGRIGVHSEVGKGSAFWFTIPYE